MAALDRIRLTGLLRKSPAKAGLFYASSRTSTGSGGPCHGGKVSVYLPLVETYRARGLSALGDPTRRAIFERLADRPRAVGELARDLPVSRPAVSQHLKVLKDAGLVVDRRAGNRRIYQLNPDGIGALRAYLDGFWNRALTAFKAAAEAGSKEVS
jgi:DNA-binding transcriptional ArsR family regulator